MDPVLARGLPSPDPAENLATLRDWAAAAAARGSTLLATPELFCSASSTTPGGWLRGQLAHIAKKEYIALAASTPEQDGDLTYVSASMWNARGSLVAHVRKVRPSAAQLDAGFSGWDGPPPPVDMRGLLHPARHPKAGIWALSVGEDARIPELRSHWARSGARAVLRLLPAATVLEPLETAGAWAPTRTGVPFPQAGPLPEPLLRPLPYRFAGWSAWQDRPGQQDGFAGTAGASRGRGS
jgi:predicted amidohydrolase